MTALREAWPLVRMSFAEWWQDNTFRFAASLAFYTIFSLAPILVIATGVASLFLAREVADRRILEEAQKLVGDAGAEGLRQVLEAGTRFGGGTLAILVGVGTLILGATAVFAELQAALNAIWDVEANPRRGFMLRIFRTRLRSFAIALGVGFLLLVSLVISAAISGLQSWVSAWGPGVPELWQAANIGASLLLITLLFAMIYRYLPDADIGWRDVWIGAAATAALFTAGKYLIGVYLGRTAVASAFGAAGSFAVLLIWVYYSALISFLGAEFTQVYARRYGVGIRPLAHAARVGRKSDRLGSEPRH